MPRPLRRRTTLLALFAACLVTAGASMRTASLNRVSPYLTRGEAATIVLLASPLPLARADDATFSDVYPTDWFAPALAAAARVGGLSPDGDRMRPFGSVSRNAFLTLVARSFSLPAGKSHSFADVPPGSPYAWIASDYGLFSRANRARLEPDRLLTRDEARAAMDAFLAARNANDDGIEREAAAAQATGAVQLYTVISTKRLRVALDPTDVRAMPTPPVEETAAGTDALRDDILSLVNAARTKAGVPLVSRSAILERSAQSYADEMDRDGFFGHVDPTGDTLRERIGATGYYARTYSDECRCIRGFALAENIARGQRTPADAMAAWMSSTSHRQAILGADYTELGIGVRGGIWVQHFGGLLTP